MIVLCEAKLKSEVKFFNFFLFQGEGDIHGEYV